MDAGARKALLARTRKAPPKVNREKSLGHPKNAPWKPGQPGMYDGTYIIEFSNTPQAFMVGELKSGDPIVRSCFTIVEVLRRPEYSGVDSEGRPWAADMGEVEINTDREHVVWPKSGEPAQAEFQDLLQTRAQFMRGCPGVYTDEEAEELLDVRQPMAGVRAKLVVSTEPQDKNPAKSFTHFRYRYLSKAGDRVEDLVSAAMPASAPAMPASVAAAIAAKRPGFIPPEAA